MAETISMPKLGFDMREGVLVRWVKNEGEDINKGDVLAEIETDKATVEVESSASGVVRKLFANPGDSIPVGTAIAVIGTADEVIDLASAPMPAKAMSDESQPKGEETPAVQSATSEPTPAVDSSTGPIKASPLARKVAKDANLDLGHITGSGPNGRIVRRDIEAALSAAGKAEIQAGAPILAEAKPGKSAAPGMVRAFETETRNDVRIQTTKLRQAIGRRLVESKQNLPHFYVSHEYKMEAVNEMRKQINGMLPEGEKLSVNDFILKATALALREFPNLNSSLNGNEVIQYGAVNVGVAVTVPGGLLTVVVKNTDQKSLRQISLEVKSMAARAREGKIKPEDVDGSTFSTSNLGMYEVENFTAIINPPEAAILAIGSSREVPVIENGQVAVGSRMKCTISVDHRISDGAEAAQFMQALGRYLEEPLRLMF